MAAEARGRNEVANAESTQQDEQKIIAQLSALYDISSALNSIIDINTLLDFIIQKTRELLNVEGVSILFCDRQKGELSSRFADSLVFPFPILVWGKKVPI